MTRFEHHSSSAADKTVEVPQSTHSGGLNAADFQRGIAPDLHGLKSKDNGQSLDFSTHPLPGIDSHGVKPLKSSPEPTVPEKARAKYGKEPNENPSPKNQHPE